MPKEIMDMVLNVYQPGFRFIETILPDYPNSSGTFTIPKRQYTLEDSKALSGASSIILMTQASIMAIMNNLYHKKFPGMEDIAFNNIDEIKDFASHTLIYCYKQVKFKKVILSNEQDKTFDIHFSKIIGKKSRNIIFFEFDYSICHGKHTGSWIGAYFKGKFD